MRARIVVALKAISAFTVLLLGPRDAAACGCFVDMPPPNPNHTPVVQAGERILFSVKNGIVTAYVQIQYKGDPGEFGWLLPLPSQPTLELGTDELFAQVDAKTAPTFRLNYSYAQGCYMAPTIGCGANESAAYDAGHGAFGDAAVPNPVVARGGIGPYDYVVLKADTSAEMLTWMMTNHYVAPPGSDGVIGQYLHAGAYFLALRLKSGESTGDLQPVEVTYASDLPMIPIVLTSVAATPDMGILVWVLGDARAVPRNYHHVVLDDMALDWQNGVANYADVMARAVREAPDRHAFVTEYAGSSAVMVGVLDPAGRFGMPELLRTETDALHYLDYLRAHGYSFTGTLLAILQKDMPEPAAVAARGVAPADFYGRDDTPGDFAGLAFDPAVLTDEIEMRIVTPTLAEGQLFRDRPYLTRLDTVLSPADMTADPVFEFNPDLPNVNNFHQATLSYDCDRTPTLNSDEGLRQRDPPYSASRSLPASLRIETLRESGAPIVETDNTAAIQLAIGQSGGGCAVATGRAGRGAALELLLLVAAATLLRLLAKARR